MASFLRRSRHVPDSWKQTDPTKIKSRDAKDRAKNKTQAKQKLKPEILIPKILQLTTGHTLRHEAWSTNQKMPVEAISLDQQNANEGGSPPALLK